MPRYRRRRFGGGPTPVMRTAMTARKKGKCRACQLAFDAGAPVVRLRLRKQFRSPCNLCQHKLIGVKWYHPQCAPADLNKAMGFDPALHTAQAAPSGGAIPPPPKPPTPDDMALAALVAIEAAIKARSRGNPVYQKQIEEEFKTYQGCKAHALRPGNPAEGTVAMKMALTRALKLVF